MTKPSKSPVFFIPAAASDPPGEVANKARRAFLALSLAGRLESEDFIALKLHFGEKGNTGHIKPAWLRGLVRRGPAADLPGVPHRLEHPLYRGPIQFRRSCQARLEPRVHARGARPAGRHRRRPDRS